MKKVLLKIGGMTCSACSTGLEKYLNKQDGIIEANVNLVMNHASIQYDEKKLDLAKIEGFVKKAGFESLGIDNLQKEEKKNKTDKIWLVVFMFIAIITLYISMGHMIGLPSIPFIDMHKHPINYTVTLLILAILAVIMGRDILKNGIKNLIHKSPNMDTLVMLGVLSSMIYSIYETYLVINGDFNCTENLYYESAVVILFFIKLGKYIEGRNKDKTKEAIQNLMTITPNTAIIIRDEREIQVTLDEIKKGDIVVCKPGEKIAVDGEILDGQTHIDESFITGESVPAKKIVGDKVVAGSINYEGNIKYKAEKIGKESTVSEIVRMVVEATDTKAPIAKIADKISGYFVPTIIALAIISSIVWWIIGKDLSFIINIFISVLVVACPCSLGLATPLSIVIASGIASKNGILVKNSEALENAHKVKTIVFDKTGTLTKGHLSISNIISNKEISDDEILKIVSSIEKQSEHPIAKGVLKYAEEKGIKQENVTDFEAISGYGVKGCLNGKEYFIGNKKLMLSEKINLKNFEKDLNNIKNTILILADSKEVLAIIEMQDTIREESRKLIKKLKNRKIKLAMLTGDNKLTAKKVADDLEIDEVISDVLPKDKANKIKELKKQGLVMMCGDGINDSVSLVTADIGVSISSGTDIAMNSSSVVLMNDNIEKVDTLINISQKTIKNIKENLFWAFFYNLCMLPIAMGIFSFWGIVMNPMFAAIAMTFSSVTVTLNSLRLKRIKI